MTYQCAMRRIRSLFPATVFACALAPLWAAAHPHIFVETKLKFHVGQDGMLQSVEVSWDYDELYSMLIFEDRGLDQDYDGALSADEIEALSGFDLNWTDGFQGDLFVSDKAGPVALGAPHFVSLTVSAGRIQTTHRRDLVQPAGAAGLVVKAYDPTFYTAYDLSGGVDIDGGCSADVIPADLNAAYSKVEELLYALPADQAESAFPEVGEAFADTVRLTCSGS